MSTYLSSNPKFSLKCEASVNVGLIRGEVGGELPWGGGGVLLHKGLMGACSQPGYVFWDFCLKQGIDFIILS